MYSLHSTMFWVDSLLIWPITIQYNGMLYETQVITSNHMLSEEKKNKKLISTNVTTRLNAIVVSCDEHLWRSSLSLFKQTYIFQ